MNAAETRRQIERLDGKLFRLRSHCDELKQLRTKYLLRPEDDSRAQEILRVIESGWLSREGVLPELAMIANGLSMGLPAAEAEIARLEDRRRLLVDELPSSEEVADAEQKAAKLVKQATEQSEQFETAWSANMEAMAGVEVAARKVVATRGQAQATIRDLSSLVERYGLDIEIPREPSPNPAESKLVGVTGVLLRDVGYLQVIAPQLHAELASARRQVEREETAA